MVVRTPNAKKVLCSPRLSQARGGRRQHDGLLDGLVDLGYTSPCSLQKQQLAVFHDLPFRLAGCQSSGRNHTVMVDFRQDVKLWIRLAEFDQVFLLFSSPFFNASFTITCLQ